MKLLITALLATASMTAQMEMKARTLAGLWTSNGVALDLVITEKEFNAIHVDACSSTSKKTLRVLDVLLRRYSLTVDTLFEPNEWATQSRFVMVNKDTMICIISGDAEGEVVYKRIKMKQASPDIK
jgi:hypothetical protein